MELLALWALFIVYGTILPFDLRFNMGTLSHGLAMANKYPWRVAGGGFPPTADLITNVLLFLPWGLLIGIHRRRGNWQLRQTLGYGLSTALAMSAAVEFLQLFSS
jgi:hypothetical protein